MSKKRIAICMSGCARSYEISSIFIKQFYEINNAKLFDESKYPKFYSFIPDTNIDLEIDYFIHVWDYNWNYNSRDLDVEMLRDKLLKIYSPVKLKIENMSVMSEWSDSIVNNSNLNSNKNFIEIDSKYLPSPKNIYGIIGQFYGITKVIDYAINYSRENNFTYDRIFRQRLDTIPTREAKGYPFNSRLGWLYNDNLQDSRPKDSIIYTNGIYFNRGMFIMEDKFYFGTSNSMETLHRDFLEKIIFLINQEFTFKWWKNSDDIKRFTGGYLLGMVSLLEQFSLYEIAISYCAPIRNNFFKAFGDDYSRVTFKKLDELDNCHLSREEIPEWVYDK